MIPIPLLQKWNSLNNISIVKIIDLTRFFSNTNKLKNIYTIRYSKRDILQYRKQIERKRNDSWD